MSRTKIPENVKLQIWVRAGGRCQYPGCNEVLWKDTLTLAQMNRAYIAHIIADTPSGPRGDIILSEELRSDLNNIMLLCDTHHRLIDKEKVEDHSPELLRKYKKDHEARIELLTSLTSNHRTEIVIFSTKIGERRGEVNFKEACDAVIPNHYPSNERGICIEIVDLNLNEQDPLFWDIVRTQIDRELSRYLGDNKGSDGKIISHFSIFALAPIPALIYFGKKIGDIRSAEVYQRHRQPAGWKWTELKDKEFKYILDYPEADSVKNNATVVINLSLSGPIKNTDIESFLECKSTIYTITNNNPKRDFLDTREQLEEFRGHWYSLIARIVHIHGPDCMIHLFAAVPNAIAVEIGRSLLKNDPQLVIYEPSKKGFQKALII